VHEPVTTMDARYSDPTAAATPWEQTRGVLEAADVFWLATVWADGRPHVTPVVGVWREGALHFSTADTEQKAINLRGNPHVVLTTGCNHWQEGFDVVVEGDAVRIADKGSSNASPRRGRLSGTDAGNTSCATAAFITMMSTRCFPTRSTSSRSHQPRSSRLPRGIPSARRVTSSESLVWQRADQPWRSVVSYATSG
jgi:Pyridoxamine 5'-phosphate oxidase